jgi:hypothetical protein
MKIFHILPYNFNPSGGIKVHYQMVALERRMGYEAYIVYVTPERHTSWFEHDVPELIWDEMMAMADKKHDLIVGWETVEYLVRSGFYHKVMYVQGEAFINRTALYYGIDVWFSSVFNESALPQFLDRETCLVRPYIDRTVFFHDPEDEWVARPTRLLIQERKAGREALDSLLAEANVLSPGISERVKHTVILPDCKEAEFASAMRSAQIFVAHSYPEGLGLPGLEAMASGCIVVGFTGGGGTDYMQHGVNSYVAHIDGDYRTLGAMLTIALGADRQTTYDMRREGRRTADFFCMSRTEAMLRAALEKYEDQE